MRTALGFVQLLKKCACAFTFKAPQKRPQGSEIQAEEASQGASTWRTSQLVGSAVQNDSIVNRSNLLLEAYDDLGTYW